MSTIVDAIGTPAAQDANTAGLFSPLQIRDVRFRNRIAVSPMCQYSAIDGVPDDWHLVHLGSRAIGGAALVIAEATGVEARGRISPGDLGLWNDEQQQSFARIAKFLKKYGAVPGIQIAHAGRKASTDVPWHNNGATLTPEQGGWTTVAPSAIPFRDRDPVPHELTREEIGGIVRAFAASVTRALDAGFEAVEIHAAHGYLLHEFYSPLSNRRTDNYGGSFENRTRIVREVVSAVREVWPDRYPLLLRISASDWAEGGWTVEDSVELARMVRPLGVDMVDCSSGGIVPHARIKVAPGYQVPFAEQVKRESGAMAAAVGMITDPAQANEIIQRGQADMILLARQFLREPYWPVRAAKELGVKLEVPPQYQRAF